MKLLNIVLAFSLAIVMASAAFGNCTRPPKDGVYTTSNGTLLGGRASETWCSGLGPGRPGNTENAMSWDGTSLGAQWHVWGMAIDASGAVETARHFDVYGNGWIDYTTNYTGGQFWLSGSHLWAGNRSASRPTYSLRAFSIRARAVPSNTRFRMGFSSGGQAIRIRCPQIIRHFCAMRTPASSSTRAAASPRSTAHRSLLNRAPGGE